MIICHASLWIELIPNIEIIEGVLIKLGSVVLHLCVL